jgi:hypothetical protein
MQRCQAVMYRTPVTMARTKSNSRDAPEGNCIRHASVYHACRMGCEARLEMFAPGVGRIGCSAQGWTQETANHGQLDDGVDGDDRQHARRHGVHDAGQCAGHELHDGAALHREDGKMHRRHEDHVQHNRQDGLRRDSEPVHEHDRFDVQLLLHDERHDGLHLQPDHGYVQVRDDQGRRLHDLHFRRQGMLRDDSGMLRSHERHDACRLHLLRHDEQHAGLLLLVRPPRQDFGFVLVGVPAG